MKLGDRIRAKAAASDWVANAFALALLIVIVGGGYFLAIEWERNKALIWADVLNRQAKQPAGR